MFGAEVAQVFGCAGAVLAVGLNAPQACASCVDRKVPVPAPVAAAWTLGLLRPPAHLRRPATALGLRQALPA